MPVWQTVLIYAVAPLVFVLILAALTLPGGRKRPRWKSGQPWPHEPVWYEPHPEALGLHGGGHEDGHGGAAALEPGHAAAALPAGSGATALGDGAAGDGGARPVPGGPLGGARGTW